MLLSQDPLPFVVQATRPPRGERLAHANSNSLQHFWLRPFCTPLPQIFSFSTNLSATVPHTFKDYFTNFFHSLCCCCIRCTPMLLLLPQCLTHCCRGRKIIMRRNLCKMQRVVWAFFSSCAACLNASYFYLQIFIVSLSRRRVVRFCMSLFAPCPRTTVVVCVCVCELRCSRRFSLFSTRHLF
jgi:hypothetical protein